MKVFAYPRVSTDEQAEKGNSLSEQQERLTAYCKAMGWDDPIWYIEDGYSAKDIRRPRLTEMLDDIKKNPGGIVITTKLDRLSRNLFDILGLIKYLEKYDFNYVSSTESFDTSTAAGRLTLQMLGMVAEFERERNSERVRENMLSIAHKLEDGKVITRPCFGYDVVKGVGIAEINIEEAVVIRKMADMALSGLGARTIAKWLNNEEKTPTKEGNEWHDRTVRNLLQRETLIGDFVYNKTYKKGSKVIARPECEWVVIENHHEPILERETHLKIKSLFQGRKTIGRHMSDDRYLLSGLVRCGHCGSGMNGKLNRSFSKKLNQENLHYRYLCDGYLKKATCHHHVVHRDDLEMLIVERIKEISAAKPGTLKLTISKPKTNTLERESVISKLEKLDRKMQKQIDAYSDDAITLDALKKATQRVEEERLKLEELLKEIDEGSGKSGQIKVHQAAQKILPDLNSGDRLKMKHAIRQIVERIRIENGEAVDIVWKPL